MRAEGLAIGLGSGAAASGDDALLQACERFARREARPQRAGHALALEMADPADFQVERRRVDAREGIGEVAFGPPVDLTEKGQGQVQLVIVLPADGRVVVHRRQQRLADGGGRTDCDEQARHETKFRARARAPIVTAATKGAESP